MKHHSRRTILLILLSCLSFTRICFGGFEADVSRLDGLHEKLVFAHEARAFTSKYLTHGWDPKKTIGCCLTPAGPLDSHDEKIKTYGDKFLEILQGMRREGVIFDQVRDSLPARSFRGLVVDILITDHLWPTKKAEIRTLVRQEVERRGQTCSIQATFESGWMEFQEERLVFRKCPMDDLIANSNPN